MYVDDVYSSLHLFAQRSPLCIPCVLLGSSRGFKLGTTCSAAGLLSQRHARHPHAAVIVGVLSVFGRHIPVADEQPGQLSPTLLSRLTPTQLVQ
jgi:hypothetical protein